LGQSYSQREKNERKMNIRLLTTYLNHFISFKL
jgi:hypothetical protein